MNERLMVLVAVRRFLVIFSIHATKLSIHAFAVRNSLQYSDIMIECKW